MPSREDRALSASITSSLFNLQEEAQWVEAVDSSVKRGECLFKSLRIFIQKEQGEWFEYLCRIKQERNNIKGSILPLKKELILVMIGKRLEMKKNRKEGRGYLESESGDVT